MKKKENKSNKKYEDIINLPHHVSSKRLQMKLEDRAAQFAPFAAVVGHETAVKEAARQTVNRKELDEAEKVEIDNQLREIEAELPNKTEVEIEFFQPDELKSGGKYISKVGIVEKLDKHNNCIYLIDDTCIEIKEIYSIRK